MRLFAKRPTSSTVASSDQDEQGHIKDPTIFPHQSQLQRNDGSYPWSIHQLQLFPPTPRNIETLPPSPCHQGGHAITATPTPKGGLYVFGGANKASRNNLYLFSTRDISARLLPTGGEIPALRVGHAIVLLSDVIIVWGGDTRVAVDARKNKQRELQAGLDNGLYLLNLESFKWTRVVIRGSGPTGRYGHAVTKVGTKFFVFGGQQDQASMNDLWSFDFNSLKKTAVWNLHEPLELERPAARAGHACIAHMNQIVIFGGSDRQHYYNDTWSFDLATQKWSNLECFGALPTPRAGHSMTLVGNVMYVFGGRGVNGTHLNDLSALDLSSGRWDTLANIGPPSSYSGHAMASVGTKLFVLDREPFARPTAHNEIHVLDTGNVKYPDLQPGEPSHI